MTGNTVWQATVIDKMLTNEKYMGDALLQKTYTVDFLTKKKVVNKGIVPQYYIEDDHEAIIPKRIILPGTGGESQTRKYLPGSHQEKKRGEEKSKYSGKYALSGSDDLRRMRTAPTGGRCGLNMERKALCGDVITG